MPEIKLTQGKVALVDDVDFEFLSRFNWIAARDHKKQAWYAQANTYRPDGKRTTVSMHRLIMGNPPGKMVDHRDGNTLDNRRQNLRMSSALENSRNMRRKSTTSQFKGVSWATKEGKWRAQIRIVGRSLHLGFFADQSEAARAYNDAAEKHFGEFARLNEPATA